MLRFFKKQGYEVLALGRRAKSDVPKRLLQYADYATYEECNGRKISCEALIHTAGLASERAAHSELVHSNIDLTRSVFESFEARHFIYISSASVYPPSKQAHDEDDLIPENKISEYGLSKLKAEQWLLQNCGETRLSILRPRAIYGVGDQVLLPRLLRLKKGRFFIKPHPLDYTVSMTCIGLLLEVTSRIIKSTELTHPLVLNVADNRTYHLSDVFEKIALLSTSKNMVNIPESVLQTVATLGLSKNISKGGLAYFLTDHFLDTNRLEKTLGQFDTPHFEWYSDNTLKQWLLAVGSNKLLQGDGNLPWHSASCTLH